MPSSSATPSASTRAAAPSAPRRAAASAPHNALAPTACRNAVALGDSRPAAASAPRRAAAVPHFALVLLALAAPLALFPSSAEARQDWALTASPTLRIGVIDGDPNYQFNMLRGALRRSDGGVVVGNDWELRYYDAAGRHLRTVGARGDGPGEFRNLAGLVPGEGDAVLAWDNLAFRVSRFDGDGNLTSTTTLERPDPLEGFGSEGHTLLPDGSVFVPLYRSTPVGATPPAGLYRPEMRLARYDPTAGRDLTLLGTEVYGGLRQQFFQLGERRYPFVQPFTPHMRYTASADRIFATDNEAFLVDVYAFDGTRVARFTSPTRRPHPVTAERLEESRQRSIAAYRERGEDARVQEFEYAWARMEKPATHPVFVSLHTDSEGLLWLRIANPATPGPNSEYAILDARGAEVGALLMPAGFTPTEIGRDYVLGFRRGEFDVLYVEMYGLARPRQ